MPSSIAPRNRLKTPEDRRFSSSDALLPGLPQNAVQESDAGERDPDPNVAFLLLMTDQASPSTFFFQVQIIDIDWFD